MSFNRAEAIKLKAKFANASKELLEEMKKDHKDTGVAFSIICACAKQCNDNQWASFMESGETPPIKLSKEQMELLQGGFSFESWGRKADSKVADARNKVNHAAYVAKDNARWYGTAAKEFGMNMAKGTAALGGAVAGGLGRLFSAVSNTAASGMR